MDNQPTYEELIQRIKDLEAAALTHDQAEKALREGEKRYRILVEGSFDGIFVQKGTTIISANQRLHRMLGYEPRELVGMDHWLVYHPEYQEITRSRAQARMRGEKITTHYGLTHGRQSEDDD